MKSQTFGRSPAEKAFDFVLLTSFLNVVLLAAAFFTVMIDSGGHSVEAPAVMVRAIQAGGVLCLINWVIGVRKVWKSRQDPVSKVLHFSSAAILAMQAIAIAAAFELRPLTRSFWFPPD